MLLRNSYNLKRIFSETSTEFPVEVSICDVTLGYLGYRKIYHNFNAGRGLFKYLSNPLFD
jgi:hypothetical protein